MIAKQLTGIGLMWMHYFQSCTYVFKCFASPESNGLSPFELAYGRCSRVLLETETNLLEGISGSFKNAINY